MKKLIPVAISLLMLLAAVSVLSAQEKVQNPELPQNLVFQWKIKTDQVNANWKNEDFSIIRNKDGMKVYYGVYFNLEDALSNVPELPKGIDEDDLTLVPFFNQWSITSEDALTLLSDQTPFDVGVRDEEDRLAVTFTVYLETFEKPQAERLNNALDQPLSFEVLPNYNFAYSAGMFQTMNEAEQYAVFMRESGYPFAEVNKYLNGEKLAIRDENQIERYMAWVDDHQLFRTKRIF
ncbi:MAG: hypothetical protein WEC59_12665 [Salibacteraceae bacterium]